MIRRIASGLATFLVAVSGLAFGPAAAHAAPIGGILIIPGESDDLAAIRLRTSAGCPQPADAYSARMTGAGFPPDGLVVTGTTSAGLSHTTGFDVYLAQTMRDFAALNGGVTLSGRYDITVFCLDSFSQTSFGEFTGSLEFGTPATYTALGDAKPAEAPPPPLSGEGTALGAQPLPTELPPGTVDGVEPGPGDGQPGSPADAAAENLSADSAASDEPNVIAIVLIAVLVAVPIVWAAVYGLSRRRSSQRAGAGPRDATGPSNPRKR